ncbi:hypothetical protein T492DRAFT_929528 [Pavlovales sp. CCMP2436]|nr:hypothetical protein T492DRAFT_929528 [Pavlovales sp. CCMP2436]|mmetsp:Transcript_28145/g.69369  ORF Transcript_28145/g.69369 Transcript_28145/m.69369 type:complete len:182 (-) Transcript_28145:81-626(-)
MLAGLAAYDDSEEDEEEQQVLVPQQALSLPLGAKLDDTDDSDDEESGDGAKGTGRQAADDAAEPEVLLPSADDVLASATGLQAMPEQLRPVRPAFNAPSERHTTPSERNMAPPPAASAPQPAAPRSSAPGQPGADAAKRVRERESVKERTEKKRKSGQSAAFLGGAWKSETEMHFKDSFDS